MTPFSRMDIEHDSIDPLCLSRAHGTNAVDDTLAEYYRAALAAIDGDSPQPAFFLTRQLAELSLKALYGIEYLKVAKLRANHYLPDFLTALRDREDDLLREHADQQLIVAFIEDLADVDRRGDEGRYPFTLDGKPSLAAVCCADPPRLREHVNRLYDYVRRRLAVDGPG